MEPQGLGHPLRKGGHRSGLGQPAIGVLLLAMGHALNPTSVAAQGNGVSASGGVPSTQAPEGAKVTNSVPQAATVPGAAAAAASPAQNLAAAKPDPTVAPLTANLGEYAGLKVSEIQFYGVTFRPGDPLLELLAQKQGESLEPEKVRETTKRLFQTGRYRNIGVRAQRSGDSVILIFSGIPSYYVGRVEIAGVKDDRLASLLEYGTNLNPGLPFHDEDLTAATESVKQVLASNGFYEPQIAVRTVRDDKGNQVDVTYTVAVGPQARLGSVKLAGKDPGISEKEFRKRGKLKAKTKVASDTVSNALSNLRGYYQKKDRLEATVSLQKSTYDPGSKTLSYEFGVEQGPIVQVKVEGAKISKSRLRLLVPVFEEGAVDNDLLNEGTFNMKDFLEQEGYFAPRVEVQQLHPGQGGETVLYTVDKGVRSKVADVAITGNKYFSSDLLRESLKVQKANAYQRSGRYSSQLVASDAKTIAAIYQSNGFSQVAVAPSTKEVQTGKNGKQLKVGEISVTFQVKEGPQQTFGAVDLDGADSTRAPQLRGLLQATSGQPFSLATLSGDRDAILSYYLSNGFDKARVELTQKVEAQDKLKTDIAYKITEGDQVSIDRVLQSGIRYTRQATVQDQIKVQAGDPLDQSALLETQRNLYNIALFNEVNAAVQNPAGDAREKNVLLQITEARRWDVTYGVGFEVQTGIPSCGMYCTKQGTTAAQQGKAGGSERISLDVSRVNFRGTDDSLTFHGTYGLLEEIATASFQIPHLLGRKSFAGQISGGYSNVQDISTFASSTLQGSIHLTEKATRKDTFIYDFQYRRVAVNPNSLAISADLIPLLSQPVRVGGPGVTWFHDTRDPSPLDASKGSYTSVQDFFANSKFGSQTNFNRTDLSNATYYTFGKSRYVFARNTRVGFIESSGTNPNAGTVNAPPPAACVGILLTTNASCNPVPLPERLYAGGATSHRGFGINDAGPRDLQTGFPVGGSAVFVNTFELRLPVQTLPYVGNSVSFVAFHDMGNVFQHVGDMFPSIGRFHQPNEATCNVLLGPIGTCNFNYFSHAIGLGARYHTAVGPIRVDFSYNLNPPSYPVFPTGGATGAPYVGQASHFNFFFSIGQAF